MKKQILSLAIVSTLSLGSLLSPISTNNVTAESISKMEQQKQEVLKKRSGLDSEIQNKESKVSEIQNEQDEVRNEINKLDVAVKDTEGKIRNKNVEIEQTTAEIDELKVEIADLIERINKRNELLKDKARSMQESGGSVSYIDVLLGAQSFSDFIDRVNAVTTIVQADKGILEQHQKDKDDLETKQQEVETKLVNLQSMKKELEDLKVQLKGKIARQNELMKELEHEEHKMHGEINDLAEQKQILAAQAATIQKAIALEKQRQAELAAERERQAKLAKQRAAKKSSGDSSSAPDPVVSSPPVSDGMFMWPARGYVSSSTGSRWGAYHFGIDIASGGTVPIVAAADGVVSRSYESGSYGQVIFITHSIDGQIYTTVYAHMRDGSRTVGQGEIVRKGQKIGLMGNTGQSTGQHLHFELHKGTWRADKKNYVNPIPYLR
ncbi:murein hydrolase activator EnvC family protein [Mesobacillus selenatarsenatis]|uniref:Peptidoglycan lytic protein P45 n=1 Tax=Mesobacillus selenatarsenatis (strain DSM 18680 / JCM 14380 / FERM P-15431 / SF-1) TaxID=1321606 RepID=A0A0A8WWG5_MESS1|nr:peptidoglycan DD-metalloendopeptidase family protein [Mesobacillus selenatarsenatis]GAM11975.1 peptidoglycan lytic protein P45 [Mesobacillus selenatarsenatis SF-1]